MGSQHKEAYMGQVELEAEDGVNEPYANKCKPIRRKWKSQARNLEEKEKNKEGQVVMKRPASSQNWYNPNSKRLKESSPKNIALSQRFPNQLLIATQLQLENGEAPPTAMRIINWNVRGLGKNRTFREAQESYSFHHVDAVVHSENGSLWRCMGIYGHPEAVQKRNTWKLLKREALRECNLRDVGCTGYPFTWSNMRFGEKAALNLVSWCSDHHPILMEVVEKGKEGRFFKRTFHRAHYEDFWSSYEKCKEIVKHEWKDTSCWSKGNPVDLFKKKSNEALADLKLWSNNEFKGRQKKLKRLKDKLKMIREDSSHHESGDEIRKMERQIDNILLDEEIYWKQISRADWLREGDKNTKFFHSKASARKRKNIIVGLEDEQGIWNEKPEDVQNEMNMSLEQKFTKEEISTALAQICPTKAPGPDGLPVAFLPKALEFSQGRSDNNLLAHSQ
ncbi:hypothetical protein WN943_027880 [Citrus x changshan-huyou]